MTAIWYSDADDRIVIEGALQTYAPRTLMAVVTDAGISVRLKVRTTNEFGPFAFDDLTDAAGDRFTSTDAALAYLNGVFARKPAIGEIFGIATVCEADILRGQPVVVSRATGRLLPARADIYPLALVVGLAEADTAEGFTLRPARGAVTLDDWSVVLGAPTLAPGLPYFLGPAGGLTADPDRTAAALTCIGLAASPTTLVVDPTDPVLL
ncbi:MULTISPECIES: hypothetical protein [Methylobacterium]|uniref:Uncharacterized protein n=1 Tax=Methylobacterium jeotgali TaxID=381630 RepID=A0ABQ4T2H9_9HYPH|nr:MULTISPECIES: hypothetical protein [Methylobacterium]PIU06895.1 MAG: hypothetical protein COT56_07110 [Methylobacterium sp. CG09_land_8_20_14_0_10_71_15]PIU16107.1 MAG: hypothetical protein COT28_01430 [Methylobacterium sp. CG08_land_8_20_14_0_20_71_15]GBU19360.1 hypothetical protein AwMethylo_35750 [Methylobacterium sp.]GJE08611.1 hypothetical protein AOPFMNJM_3954 [Methylobacterium jeotgali]